ncbi:MAG TPA: TMEM165/GDT1 family protein [Polyangiaceae bacterium]|nr:TMEM165/GDT1 family protein [Polyangiaceae bacterium]
MRALRFFVYVFGVIFVAELPDKTALAALVLATRRKALPVFFGAGLALTIQSIVAVAAGSALSLLPARPVHIGAGILFLVSAVIMWIRTDPDEDAGIAQDAPLAAQAPAASFFGTLATSFGVVFIAEWGDLTQLATAAMAARERAPLLVLTASTLALWCVVAIAVTIGHRASKAFRRDRLQKAAAGVFAAVGVAFMTGWL